MNQKQTYQYTTKQGNENTVHCTKLEYLYLKLNYGINGLTPREYLEYKQLSNLVIQSEELRYPKYIEYLENQIGILIELLTDDQLSQFLSYLEQNPYENQEDSNT